VWENGSKFENVLLATYSVKFNRVHYATYFPFPNASESSIYPLMPPLVFRLLFTQTPRGMSERGALRERYLKKRLTKLLTPIHPLTCVMPSADATMSSKRRGRGVGQSVAICLLGIERPL
jgi:hypothetical protein